MNDNEITQIKIDLSKQDLKIGFLADRIICIENYLNSIGINLEEFEETVLGTSLEEEE